MLRSLVCAAALFASTQVLAADHTYQVTGPVLEVSDSKIVVQKGKEKWEISRDAATKDAAVKVGDKVTVTYSMTATKIEAKAEAKKK